MTITRTSWGAELPEGAQVGEDWWSTWGHSPRTANAPEGWQVRSGSYCGARGADHEAARLICTRPPGHSGPHSGGYGFSPRTYGEWGMRREPRDMTDCGQPDCDADSCSRVREMREYWQRNAAGMTTPAPDPASAPAGAPEGYLPADRVREVLTNYARTHSSYMAPITEGLRNLGLEMPSPGFTGRLVVEIPVRLTGNRWTGSRAAVRESFARRFPQARISEAIDRLLRSAKDAAGGPDDLGVLVQSAARVRYELRDVEAER